MAVNLFRREIIRSAGVVGREWKSAILCTLHKSGNSLNHNPHVHPAPLSEKSCWVNMIAAREIVNICTGEIKNVPFVPYRRIRFQWQRAVLRHLVREGLISSDESATYRRRYSDGFHVYFQPITGEDNDVLLRTAEYMATGFFHNSQILKVDHEKKTITFRFRKWRDRNIGDITYSIMTLGIFEFTQHHFRKKR